MKRIRILIEKPLFVFGNDNERMAIIIKKKIDKTNSGNAGAAGADRRARRGYGEHVEDLSAHAASRD